MPREGVPYPGGAICRLKCQINELWQAVRGKLQSINGVPGDGNGNVKILAGQNVQIVNDQLHNEITVSATDAVGLLSINGVSGDGSNNVKILAGQNVQIVNDQANNEITVSATDTGTVLRKASVTLTAAGWNNNSQTVTVTGLAADEDVLVAADPADYTDWNTAGIRAVSQAAGSVTFDCDTAPASDLTANLVIGRLNV